MIDVLVMTSDQLKTGGPIDKHGLNRKDSRSGSGAQAMTGDQNRTGAQTDTGD